MTRESASAAFDYPSFWQELKRRLRFIDVRHARVHQRDAISYSITDEPWQIASQYGYCVTLRSNGEKHDVTIER